MNEQKAPDQNAHADRQAHVGEIENKRPAHVAEANLDEVDDLPVSQTVDEIAEGAAKNERKGQAVGKRRPAHAIQINQNGGAGNGRENDEKNFVAKIEAKCHARILNVGEMQNVAQNHERFVKIKSAFDRHFGELVRNQDKQGEEENGHDHSVVNSVGLFASSPVNRLLKSY